MFSPMNNQTCGWMEHRSHVEPLGCWEGDPAAARPDGKGLSESLDSVQTNISKTPIKRGNRVKVSLLSHDIFLKRTADVIGSLTEAPALIQNKNQLDKKTPKRDLTHPRFKAFLRCNAAFVCFCKNRMCFYCFHAYVFLLFSALMMMMMMMICDIWCLYIYL